MNGTKDQIIKDTKMIKYLRFLGQQYYKSLYFTKKDIKHLRSSEGDLYRMIKKLLNEGYIKIHKTINNKRQYYINMKHKELYDKCRDITNTNTNINTNITKYGTL